MAQMPRVLMIAESCNPEWTSVPLVGYNLYHAVAERADVTLVTQIRNRDALKRHVPAGRPMAFIDSERVAGPFHRLGRLLTLGRGLGWTTRQAVMWLPYLYFERLAFRQFAGALRRGEFDLIHRVTPLTPTYPSPMALWTDVPMILGPLNGGLPWPKGTGRVRLAEMEWLSFVRGAYRVLPYWRATFRRAAHVFAGSKYTLESLPAGARDRCTYMPENGINPAIFHAEGRPPPSAIRPFRLLFVGRLVPYKGAQLVLRAVASSEKLRNNAEVVIAGDGPQRAELERLRSDFGLGERVRFTGNLPQRDVAELMRQSSVFAFPSLREFGGAVVMEAMACGLPPVVVNYGGPGELITPQSGVGVPLGRAGEIEASLRRALEQLLDDPARLDAISSAAADFARANYTWEAKADRVVEVYERLIGELSPTRRDRSPMTASPRLVTEPH